VLRYIPNLGPYEARLREKARLVFLPPDSQAGPGGDPSLRSGGGAGSLQSMNTFYMYVGCGAGYTAYFTMWYFTPPFSNDWTVSTASSGDYRNVCQGTTQPCSFFSNSSTPLQSGDTVMMVVGINGNKDWVPTNIWFTYSPTAAYTAEVDCYGQTLNPYFEWSVTSN
jgi:hypothetical protein